MEFTREIYWNVGHGSATLVPMYLLAIVAVGLFVYGFLQRVKIYKIAKPLNRFDNRTARLVEAVKEIVLQSTVTRVTGPGYTHAIFLWSFLLLLIGTTLIVIQADFTDLFFGIKFLKGTFYKLFSVVLDLAGLAAIVMLAGLLVRRYLIRPEGLESNRDDVIMHGLLFSILITGFIVEGSRMAVTEVGTALAPWSPIGNVIAMMLLGLEEESLRNLHKITWWFHLLLVMGFIGIIPQTKLRHIFTTSCNYFFKDRGPTGKLVNIDLEDEDAETFGAATVADMTWKDIFDADACTLCKRCQDRCPAYATDKPLSPMKIVNQIGEVAFSDQKKNLIETIGKDALWACTTCRACQDICPAKIEHVNKIVEMRRSLVLMEGEFPGEEVMAAMEQTEVNGNPLGIGYATRADWAEELEVKPLSEDKDVDILYFVGCYGSFDKRNIKIAKSFVSLCQAAGIKVGILGKEEKCCGEPMRKMGNEYLYQGLAMENIETMKRYRVNTIVTTCPHCFNTLEKDYRDLGLEAKVINYTTYLEELLKEGKLQLKQQPLSCTYHDSCYLGRHNEIYSAPRNLIKAAGGTIVEMEKNRDQAFCCSAGGGRIMAEENIGERINIRRVKMARETGAEILLSNCPFCLTMFEDGVKGADIEESLQPRDISEILADRLIEKS